MSIETDLEFIKKAIEFLELANYKNGVLQHTTIMRIQNVIDELKDILRDGE